MRKWVFDMPAMAMADRKSVMPQAAMHNNDRNVYLWGNHSITMSCCKQRSSLENFSTTSSAISLHVRSQRHWWCHGIHCRWWFRYWYWCTYVLGHMALIWHCVIFCVVEDIGWSQGRYADLWRILERKTIFISYRLWTVIDGGNATLFPWSNLR